MIPFFLFLKTRVQEFAIKNLVPLPFVFPNPTATKAGDKLIWCAIKSSNSIAFQHLNSNGTRIKPENINSWNLSRGPHLAYFNRIYTGSLCTNRSTDQFLAT
jgi:hypothetical protein